MEISPNQEKNEVFCAYLVPRELSLCLKYGFHKCRLKQEQGLESYFCDFVTGDGNTWKAEYDARNARKCPMYVPFTPESKLEKQAGE